MKKMKVYLATQAISVAGAIKFRDVLNEENDKNRTATCEFLRIFNRVFDLLNSKVHFNHHGKDFEKIQIYVLTLRHEKPFVSRDGDETEVKEVKIGTPLVVDGPRK
jgi:hypothetical protein